MFIGDWMGRGALYWPEHTAVVDVAKGDAGRFSYRAMNARAEALAGWLRDVVGVSRGDRVGLVAHNGVEYLDVFFACGKLGAIFVPYNWRLHAQELTDLVRDTGPRVLLFSDDFREGVAAVRKSLGESLKLVHLEGQGLPESRPYTEALAHVSASKVTNEQVGEEDIICLLFTGGTTGKSKGARISYRMVAWNTLNTLIHEVRPGDVTVTHTPMFHTGGLLVYTVPMLTSGGTVVLMRRWDADEMLRLVEHEKVTLFFAVPTQYQQMYDAPRFRTSNLSSVRFVTSGGAPLPVPLIQAWQAVHAVPFKQGFGMTEFGPGIFSMGPEFAVSKAGSIGRPNYFIDARLVDDDGRDVPEGATGELILKAPSMCSGYFENAEATAEAIDAAGWFHTGDLAHRDADGFYFINGRKKDMFISGGENVYPLELETALYEHPAVQACSVVGVPDAKWGEVGRAFVVLKPGASATAEALLEHLRGRVARYKVPKKVELVDSLPVSAAGKILKRELREWAIAADART
ncbi:MAG TPA: long-chain fatty acid--CoA ligase [Archangium sp.]|nr:long-chain fatty acid--CoA ligase [Archangium sp.]